MLGIRATQGQYRLLGTFLLARNVKPAKENTLSSKCRSVLRFGSPDRIPPFQLNVQAVRGLATSRELSRKIGGEDGEIGDSESRQLVRDDVLSRDESSESTAATKGKKMMILSPPTVQVFADPNMSQTVRNVSVDVAEIKGQLKFMREEFSESSFEVLKLVQGRSSVVAALKETRKFCQDNQSAINSLKTEQKKMDEFLAYISKMIARHENHLNDAKRNRDRDAIAKKIDSISQRIDQANSSIKTLRVAVHDNLQMDLKKSLTDVKQLRNDVIRLEQEIKYRGREISELKSKTPTQS